jgi:hypothetical protein
MALGAGIGLAGNDVGQQRESDLAAHSEQVFGVGKPLA